MSIDLAELAAFPLCAGLTEAEVQQVARLLRRVAFLPGSVVMSQEQPGHEAYLVANGTLHVVVDRSDGESPILAVLGKRTLIGELGVVQGAVRSATVVTIDRTLLWTMQRDDFHACLRTIPQLALNLNAILAQRLRLASAQIVILTTPNHIVRVARILTTFVAEHGVRQGDGSVLIPFRLTQSDLGRLVNLARASVNRAMRSLTKAKIISTDGRYQITVHDVVALSRYAL